MSRDGHQIVIAAGFSMLGRAVMTATTTQTEKANEYLVVSVMPYVTRRKL